MKEELDKKLVEKYPEIFVDRYGKMTETAMCWGFSCGDGWYDLIDMLCDSIQGHIDFRNTSKTMESVPQVTASQVKEKFGGLRFYIEGGDETVDGMIELAENLSYRICEKCGCPGKTRGGGWVRTLCDKHAAEKE